MPSASLFDGVESLVQWSLDALGLHGTTDAEATKRVKVALCKAGRALGYRVYASGVEAAGREWLFDLVWTEETDDGSIIRVPLVLESEWSTTGGSDDFKKLMVARAEHRVMVMNPQHGRSPKESIVHLVAEVDQFAMSEFGDRYLFACWDDDGDGHLEWWLHVVGQTSALRTTPAGDRGAEG